MKNGANEIAKCRSLTRRKLMQGASVGMAVTLAGPAISNWAQSAKPAAGAKEGKSAGITPASLPQKWTVEEIQRRWAAVRTEMKKVNYDCLLVGQHHPGEMITERQDGAISCSPALSDFWLFIFLSRPCTELAKDIITTITKQWHRKSAGLVYSVHRG